MKSGHISKTAAYVAIKFYGLSQIKPFQKLFDAEVTTFYDRLVFELPSPLNRYHSLLDKAWFRSLCIAIEELMLPGDLMHILMRKYYISSIIEEFIQEGHAQIIILGAGFDHVGATYSQKGILCTEIDTVSVLNVKQQFYEKNNYSNDKLTLHAANINRSPLPEILPAIPGLDSKTPTIVIAEGFFDYLTPYKFSETLNALSTFFTDKLKLVTTVFSLDELTTFHAFVFKNAVRSVGEKLQLHASIKEFSNILQKNSFHINHLWHNQEMRNKNYVLQDSKMAVLPGFYLLEADKNK